MAYKYDTYATEAMKIASGSSDSERGAAAALLLLENFSHKEEEIEKIEGNLKAILKMETLPSGLWYHWDCTTRVFKVGFNKEAYFNKGGREVLMNLKDKMNRLGFPFYSGKKWDYWVGYFPRIVPQTVREIEEEKTATNEAKPEVKPKVIRRRPS